MSSPLLAALAFILITPAATLAGDVQPTDRTPSPPNAKVFFLDLEEGAHIPPNTVVRFGASGIEIVPAGDTRPNSGHHHLLIDSALPPLDQKIPSDFNHLHFGRGQTETELSLSPGEHTLQLLLGDHRHVPHEPPVMSKLLHVFVEESAASQQSDAPPTRRKSPPGASVYFITPHNGDVIRPTSTIHFGLKNMGVAPAGVNKPNTGHHHLIVDADTPPLDRQVPNDPNHLHFGGGQTEKTITLTPGRHTLQLVLADDQHIPHDPPVISERITVTVASPKETGAKPAARRRPKRSTRHVSRHRRET